MDPPEPTSLSLHHSSHFDQPLSYFLIVDCVLPVMTTFGKERACSLISSFLISSRFYPFVSLKLNFLRRQKNIIEISFGLDLNTKLPGHHFSSPLAQRPLITGITLLWHNGLPSQGSLFLGPTASRHRDFFSLAQKASRHRDFSYLAQRPPVSGITFLWLNDFPSLGSLYF